MKKVLSSTAPFNSDPLVNLASDLLGTRSDYTSTQVAERSRSALIQKMVSAPIGPQQARNRWLGQPP